MLALRFDKTCRWSKCQITGISVATAVAARKRITLLRASLSHSGLDRREIMELTRILLHSRPLCGRR